MDHIPLQKPSKSHKTVNNPAVLPLHINPRPDQSGFGVQVTVQIDGQTVDEFTSDSFYPMFYQILEAMMHGGLRRRDIMWRRYYQNLKDITSVYASGGTIGVNVSDYFWLYDEFPAADFIGARVGISGVKGIALNGTYRVRAVLDNGSSSKQFELEQVDGTDIAIDPAGWTAGTGAIESFSVPVDNTFIERSDDDKYRSIKNSQVWNIIVGRGAGNENFDNIWLDDRIADSGAEGELQHTGVSFTSQTTNKPSSSFTLIRSFQNPVGNANSVDVAEYGIISQIYSRDEGHMKSLLSRDVRATKTVGPDSQISVQLTAKVQLTPDTQDTETDGTNGGFLEGFLNRLRSLATETAFNHDKNNYFGLANAPGGGALWNDYQQVDHARYGLVVGTDNTFVSMTDDGMLAPIGHGVAPGQLYFYGTDVGPLQVQADAATPSNNQAYFEITRMFENKTANPITIKEVGLNCNSLPDGLSDPYPIARFALETADQITIPAGEIQPIVIRIGKG